MVEGGKREILGMGRRLAKSFVVLAFCRLVGVARGIDIGAAADILP
jgi:hypothetical protein